MIEYFRRRPLLLAAVAAVFLCVIGFYSNAAILFLSAFLLVFLLGLLLIKADPALIFSLFLLLPLCINLLACRGRVERLSTNNGAVLTGEFTVAEEPNEQSALHSVILEAYDAPPLRAGERILATGDFAGLRMADRTRVKLRLHTINEKFQPRWFAENIYLRGTAEEVALTREDGDPVLCGVRRLRQAITGKLFANMGETEAATVLAITLGDRSYLSESFEGAVRAAGLSHVMVVSGMHLAVLVALILKCSGPAAGNPRLRFLLILFTVPAMAGICGFSKSILRAGACALLFAVSLLFGRPHTPENTLGGAVILLLTAFPFLIFSVSFRLSALSTLGIVCCALPLIRYREAARRKASPFRGFLFSSLMVSFSAMAFSLPVALFVFGYFSTVSLITNLLITPAVTLLLSYTVIALLFSFLFPFLSSLLLAPADLLAALINRAILFFGGLPFAVVYTAPWENAVSFLLPAGEFGWMLFLKNRRQKQKKRILADLRQKKAPPGPHRLPDYAKF